MGSTELSISSGWIPNPLGFVDFIVFTAPKKAWLSDSISQTSINEYDVDALIHSVEEV